MSPVSLLKAVGTLYEKVLGDRNKREEFSLEEEAFSTLLQQRVQSRTDGSVVFQLLDLEVSANTPSSLIVDEEGARFLRVDVLAQ